MPALEAKSLVAGTESLAAGSADPEAGFVFSVPVGAVLSVERKSEVMGEVVGIEMSLRCCDAEPVCLFESSRSFISKLLLLVGSEGGTGEGVGPSDALFDCVGDAIGRLVLGIRLLQINGVSGGVEGEEGYLRHQDFLLLLL